ncbi:uncharacterized protein N7458_005694 [Penicillium daleae]|uniref:Uncharacterized protein n=1 Tax=Penicillium daleae TaxID=63821 RepID=A0AAD6C9E3_9EURO|nr:uncharacterized protein N7458_005694 [Penicillium daleae]KAJ5454738.1 hypothetical protein N7458_005694 [Penicillium daleae]
MRIWFQKGIGPGTNITLDRPVPLRWKIVQKLSEDDLQLTEGEHLSLAVTKILCLPHKLALMRCYMQVPYENTEMDVADTGATQATTYIPEELLAYQDLTSQELGITPKLLGFKITSQDKSGLVPGGFVVWLAWEMVPGLRLGIKDGCLWASCILGSRCCRKRRNPATLCGEPPTIGHFSDTPALSSLVWDKDSKTLYFIGFRLRNKATGEPRITVPDVKWTAYFGLAQPDSHASLKGGWNQDTSGWKW